MQNKKNIGRKFGRGWRAAYSEGIPICFKPGVVKLIKGGNVKVKSGVVKVIKGIGNAGRVGWRSYLQIYNAPTNTRVFGTWRQTRLSAVNMLLAKFEGDLTFSEMNRVRRISGIAQASVAEHHGDEKDGKEVENRCVPFVHQIYGLFRDGKAMSDLFVESQRRWKQCAASMGVQYHCWTADEVDHLMSNYYKDYWDMYKDVRYPVMRCDIGRIAILHRFGGLYSDLDVLPNRCEYKHSELSVCSVPPGRKGNGKDGPGFLDMEVVIAAPGNPFLMEWLKHMKTQIERIDYKKGGYASRRMRYIFHTTGPRGMETFFKRSGEQKTAKIGYIQCNRFWDYDILTPSQKEEYDVLTQRSNSYYTSAFKIDKPVVERLEKFAPFCITHSKRIKTKTSMHGVVVGGTCMASDLLLGSQAIVDENEGSQDPEMALLQLWDHIRMKGQNQQWLESFFEGMDNEQKIDIQTALVFMDEHDERTDVKHEVVLGKDINFKNIVAVAARLRKDFDDPMGQLRSWSEQGIATEQLRHRMVKMCRPCGQ